jgi:hypothetical protein
MSALEPTTVVNPVTDDWRSATERLVVPADCRSPEIMASQLLLEERDRAGKGTSPRRAASTSRPLHALRGVAT